MKVPKSNTPRAGGQGDGMGSFKGGTVKYGFKDITSDMISDQRHQLGCLLCPFDSFCY